LEESSTTLQKPKTKCQAGEMLTAIVQALSIRKTLVRFSEQKISIMMKEQASSGHDF
jgi:hypothetical protein